MTCDQLREQIADLTAQSDTLNQDVIDDQAEIGSDFTNAIIDDNKGGTLPPGPPPTISGVQARITYLNTLAPVPSALISEWTNILNELETLAGVQAALTTTNAALGSMKSQYTAQGCQPSL
jgi:hypothetical protein